MICRWRSTYEGCALVPPVTSSVGDFELIRHFQEKYATLFSNCYNKQGIQSNLPSYRPMNQGTICAKVYPEGVQPVKGNNCGLIPSRDLFVWKYILKVFNQSGEIIQNWFLFQRNSRKKQQRNMNMLESDWNGNEALSSAANSFSRNVNDTELVMTSRIWRMDIRVSFSFG